MRDNKIILLSD